jgi:predicted DsbA family dithiol-disulfide isomerase
VVAVSNGTLKVWIDFLCPWARIGALWIQNVQKEGGLDLDLEWKSFSLENINLPEDMPADDLWSSAPERRGLYPAAAFQWVKTNAPDKLNDCVATMFDARHVDKEKIGQPPVTAQILSNAGLDGQKITDDIASDPKWLEAARADHDEADQLGIFGVPTFVFPDTAPAFTRLLEVTDGKRAVEIYEHVRTAALDPTIHEIKRPSLMR